MEQKLEKFMKTKIKNKGYAENKKEIEMLLVGGEFIGKDFTS